jgi:signal transduction histidine kinase
MEQDREVMKELAHRVVEAQEAERRYLARELHDELGQTLTCLKMSLEISERPGIEPERARRHREDAKQAVEDLIRRVRHLSLELRPASLDDLGLLPALQWHVERFQTSTGITVALVHEGLSGQRFGTLTETAAFRIAQEALTNIARHARTDAAWVEVRWRDSHLHVLVEDEGIGFQREMVQTNRSHGLSGMQERALSVGGSLDVRATPGGGVRVEALLPPSPNAGDRTDATGTRRVERI